MLLPGLWDSLQSLENTFLTIIAQSRQPSPVPKNNHIWDVAEKLLAVFASGTVAPSMQDVQVTRYDLISFINTTKMMEGIEEELKRQRLSILQNRLDLDQLLAEHSGVCVTEGEACCTYIAEHDEDGHAIEEAINNLTFMALSVIDCLLDRGGMM
ncbi:hypothetical protein QQF64_014336 [Cirrhinus molitorella]|uniref:Uncharacterized protein n=1 Tax=Cirrhinus molitorella TaxID=172907 RepID=A0ABR3NSI9_9TELE